MRRDEDVLRLPISAGETGAETLPYLWERKKQKSHPAWTPGKEGKRLAVVARACHRDGAGGNLPAVPAAKEGPSPKKNQENRAEKEKKGGDLYYQRQGGKWPPGSSSLIGKKKAALPRARKSRKVDFLEGKPTTPAERNKKKKKDGLPLPLDQRRREKKNLRNY